MPTATEPRAQPTAPESAAPYPKGWPWKVAIFLLFASLALIPLLLVKWEDPILQPLVTAREAPEGEILPRDLTTDRGSSYDREDGI